MGVVYVIRVSTDIIGISLNGLGFYEPVILDSSQGYMVSVVKFVGSSRCSFSLQKVEIELCRLEQEKD